ncbi:MAG TPA: ComEC/Rec2 family competence protein [Pyrinomonadaceae bacterium]|nr:ComEC/Rec2 family competence protein [Pyrinomonadaceae bacterium]
MRRATRGCGCAIAVFLVLASIGGYLGYKFVYPSWKTRNPPPSGAELTIKILDVGPVDGDSILIIAPSGVKVLIDAGDVSRGKSVVEALKKNNIQQLDYFIATHPHPDHIGGAAEVFKAVKVLNVIDNGEGPVVPPSAVVAKPASAKTSKKPAAPVKPNPKTASVTKFYDDYQAAIKGGGVQYEKAQPGKKYDLGGGAFLTILGPTEPYFTKDQMKSGGNEPNANSIIARLDYGSFSMLLPGDAEEQTEHRLLTKDLNLQARVLKIAHHGSKYATTDDFLARVKPEIAIISCGAWNRYGHPHQSVLDRLKAANVKLYRTDLQGEITLTSRGGAGDISVKTAKEPSEDLWTGRLAQKDDSSRSGFIAYGDFGPPPKPRKQ